MVNYYHDGHLEILLAMIFITIKVLLRIAMSNSAINTSEQQKREMKTKLATSG